LTHKILYFVPVVINIMMKEEQFINEGEHIVDKYKGLRRCVIKVSFILVFYIVSVFAKRFSEVDSEI
jgi:mRNA-degrading endonuclease YafQ of YafQ-DinJ toxin-antitoxin module